MADRQGISMKYLEMIVGHLKKAELVESTRGKEGGYRLCRPCEAYTVGEILRCLEDNLAPVACIRDGSVACDHAALCQTIPMWMELDEITNRYLDSVTLTVTLLVFEIAPAVNSDPSVSVIVPMFVNSPDSNVALLS